MRKLLASFSFAALACCAQALAAAQEPAAPVDAPEDRYEVFLLTMDQGDATWERFGHNAILIRDRTTGQDLAWNWGLFSFQAENFLLRFFNGTMTYGMGPSELEPFLQVYAQTNRTVYANEILLTEEEAGRLDEFVRWNFAPENRDYVYDYFLDNCSTRVRDALAGVLGGILRPQFESAATAHSYRWHVRRLVQETGWLDYGLHFLMGPRTDEPISEWQTMFIPMDMMRLLEGVERPDPSGAMVSLLGPRQVLFQATRAPTPAEAPPFSVTGFLFGLGLAGGLLALGFGAARGRSRGFSALGLAAAVGAWGLISGLVGSLLVSVWFTDHEFGYWNSNALLLGPLGLVIGALAVGSAFQSSGLRGSLGRRATWFALVVAGLTVLVAALSVVQVIDQDNAQVLALALPVNIAVAAALYLSRGEGRSRGRSSRAA